MHGGVCGVDLLGVDCESEVRCALACVRIGDRVAVAIGHLREVPLIRLEVERLLRGVAVIEALSQILAELVTRVILGPDRPIVARQRVVLDLRAAARHATAIDERDAVLRHENLQVRLVAGVPFPVSGRWHPVHSCAEYRSSPSPNSTRYPGDLPHTVERISNPTPSPRRSQQVVQRYDRPAFPEQARQGALLSQHLPRSFSPQARLAKPTKRARASARTHESCSTTGGSMRKLLGWG